MTIKHDAPERPELGERDGLAYALFLPKEEPRGGIVILHGAGSSKESHFDFARGAQAYGLAALAFDARGHGASEGVFGDRALDDVRTMCDVVFEHTRRLALRGSSMGGFCAISAGAVDERVEAVVAICPAPEYLLLRLLRSDRELEFELDREACERWLEQADLSASAAALSPRVALMLLHAQGDDEIPYTVSQELHAAAGDPKKLVIVPGGHHRSLQHDGELQGESIKYVLRAFER